MPESHLSNLKFSDLPLAERVARGVEEAGFTFCTPIQASSLPIALDGKDVAGQAQTGTGKTAAFLLAAFAVGVGIGSLLCERLSGHRIELGLVPFGAIGMSWFALDLFFANPDAHAVPASTIAEFLARPSGFRPVAQPARSWPS